MARPERLTQVVRNEPLRRTLLMLILTTQMFPLVVLIIPLFVLMRNADLIGTYQGLVITYLAFTIPLAIWIMRGFIVTIPEELEHAAMTDGATRVGGPHVELDRQRLRAFQAVP